jgi:1,4-dihydroxy-2-naphthoyl-CoA synthase
MVAANIAYWPNLVQENEQENATRKSGDVVQRRADAALIEGAAAGAGLSLALACDLRIANRSAKLTTAFAKVALSGDFGGTYF